MSTIRNGGGTGGPASASQATAAPELLPEELLWAESGHASDVVLTAIADGQREIIPLIVRSHVERCPTCMGHLGNAALLSLHSERELQALAQHTRLTAKRPLPRVAIGLGLAVALIGLIPSFFELESEPGGVRGFVTHGVPLFLKGLGTLAQRLDAPGSMAGLFITYAAATMLVVMGIAVVRLLPKKETSR